MYVYEEYGFSLCKIVDSVFLFGFGVSPSLGLVRVRSLGMYINYVLFNIIYAIICGCIALRLWRDNTFLPFSSLRN